MRIEVTGSVITYERKMVSQEMMNPQREMAVGEGPAPMREAKP